VRRAGTKEVLVLLNFSPNRLRFDITGNTLNGLFKNVFSAAPNNFTTEKSFEMAGWEFLVYEK